MLLNCGVGEDSWESLGLQGDPASPSQRRSVLGVHWKDWCWSWNSNTLVTWCEELTHLKRPWCWERLRAGEGTTEDEMVGWHHWLNGHGFGWTLGVGDGQGGLACRGSWGRKESDTTEWLNWTDSMGEKTWLVLSRKFMEISFGTILISSFPFFCRLLIVHPKPSEKIFGLLVLFTMFSHYDYHSSNIYSNLQLLPDLAILWVANSIHWFWQP